MYSKVMKVARPSVIAVVEPSIAQLISFEFLRTKSAIAVEAPPTRRRRQGRPTEKSSANIAR